MKKKHFDTIRTSMWGKDDWCYIIPTVGVSFVKNKNIEALELCFSWLCIKYYCAYELKYYG